MSLIITGIPSIHNITAQNTIIAGIKREANKKPENINVIKKSVNLSDKEPFGLNVFDFSSLLNFLNSAF